MFYIQISFTDRDECMQFHGSVEAAKAMALALVGTMFGERKVIGAWVASADGEVFDV